MGFLWFSYGFTMGFPMVFPWFSKFRSHRSIIFHVVKNSPASQQEDAVHIVHGDRRSQAASWNLQQETMKS